MKASCTGTACIRHGETGEIYEIDSSELVWDAVDGDERGMGAEIHHEAIIDHPDLGLLTWGLWEYPLGYQNYQKTEAGTHQVIQDFSYSLEHDDSGSDEWVDYLSPDDPFAIFMDSYDQTSELLKVRGSDHHEFILNRMIFSHQVTAMEAYLSDTLINAVMSDAKIMQLLIEKDIDLTKEKFTLAEIIKEPTLVKRKVKEHLRSILYHNLAKVNVLYKIALGVRILDGINDNDKDRLFKAVSLRHDCVHRNGFDSEGNQHKIFTNQYVQDIADLIKDFVKSVEDRTMIHKF